jgi:hydrogenase expression/formation protein HypE
VVDKGKADQVFINTAGIGVVEHNFTGPAGVQQGDAIVLNGDLGRHGVAILSVREGLEFEAPIESDTQELWTPVKALFDAGVEVHCLRDCTRGGLSSALNEIAQARRLTIRLEEPLIPVTDVVRGACEMLGLDPLYVANEGRFIAFVPHAHVEAALRAIGSGAVVIGRVEEASDPVVLMKSRIGGTRVVDMLSGEQLPRIC